MMCWDQFLRFVNSEVVELALTFWEEPALKLEWSLAMQHSQQSRSASRRRAERLTASHTAQKI